MASNFQYQRSEDGGYQIVSGEENLDNPEEVVKLQKRQQRLEEAINRYKSESLWITPTKPIEYSKDLYDYIQQLLGSNISKTDEQSPTEVSQLSRSYELTQDACELINGGAKGNGLALELSKVSVSRLQSKDSVKTIPFKFSGFSINKKEKPRLYLFDLGMGLLTVELTIDQQFLQEFGLSAAVEFTHTITHINKYKNNVQFVPNYLDSTVSQSTDNSLQLVNVFERLLGGNVDAKDSAIQPVSHLTRLFSYASLRLHATKFDSIESDITGVSEDIELLAYKLAHRQTDHYLPNLDQVKSDVYSPFINISHCHSVEGGATVINTAYMSDANDEGSYQALRPYQILLSRLRFFREKQVLYMSFPRREDGVAMCKRYQSTLSLLWVWGKWGSPIFYLRQAPQSI